MNKTWRIILFIAAIILIIALKFSLNKTSTVDWEESYNERSTKPFGVSVFYKELPKILDGEGLKTIYYAPYNYFYANSEEGYGDHVAQGTYMLVGNSDYLEPEDVEELLIFSSRGNTLFMSDHHLPKALLDTLDLDIKIGHNKDSLTALRFQNPELQDKNISIDRSPNFSYFSRYNTANHQVLGYVNENPNWVNFLEIPVERGTIYLHLEPKTFTNYNLLTDQRYLYTEGVLSYLPNATIYFDSYTKYLDSHYGAAKQKSDLNWFLQQPQFKWAWYLALLLTALFVTFNAKRRQRIIPTIKPLKNTTVEFVKTISNLYYETQDHKNLIDKKITYFLEKVRSEHNIDTTLLDAAFISNLAQKSGKNNETVEKTINFINWLRAKNEFSEDHLLTLNQHMEAFYST